MSTSVAEKLARKSARKPSTKQVRLRLVYIDFWSSLKLAFLIGLCLGIIVVVGTFLIWSVLNSLGVFSQVNTLFQGISGPSGPDLVKLASLGRVMGFGIVIAILDVIVVTVLGAIAALLYNLSVAITGGLLVGFSNT